MIEFIEIVKIKAGIKLLGELMYRLVFAAGLIAIYSYCDEKWPAAFDFVVIAGVTLGLVSYLWCFFLNPLRVELKRISRGDGVAKVDSL